MVDESRIIILLEQVWIYAGKEKIQCEGNLFYQRHWLKNPNGGYVGKLVLNLLLKIYDDPTINLSKIIVLLRYIWVYAKKRECFGKGRRELLFGIIVLLLAFYLSYFSFFIYFISYQTINLINKFIFPHLFNYKNLIIFSKTLFIYKQQSFLN